MTGAGQSRRRALALRTGAALLILAAAGGVARGEPLPGLLDRREVARARAEAAEQKRDAQRAVRESARALGYSDREIARVLQPAMERSGSFQTRLDDGTVIEFPWYRTGFAENRLSNTGKRIDRDASGAAVRMETNKGGVRLHHGVFADEVYALALKMDVKLAITGDAIEGHSVRGAKGGIGAGRVIKVGSRYKARVGDLVDPASPALDRQHLMRSFARSYRASGGEVGPGLDIQAGDVNTKAREMKTLAESYGSRRAPSAGVSGKEVITRPGGEVDPRGGIAYRSVSTGEGVWMSARLAARRAGVKLRGATVVAQGWGEVGRAFGMAAVKDGARVIAVQNLWTVNGKKVAGTLLHPRGAEATPREVRAWLADIDAAVSSGQDLASFKGGVLEKTLRPGLDASQVRADIVGLNALGSVLTEETVPQYVRSGTHAGGRKVIVEGANLAQTAGGARLIDQNARSMLVVSGELANIGGVHVSNLEAVQNLYSEEVTSKTARRSLSNTMRSGFRRAMEIADTRGVSERAAIELAAVDALMKRSLQRQDAPRRSLER
ncbi:MAG TPA: hypothetical protein VKZ63_13980, partial [Kofleriaceae bacterium]|nr:hypothetical protein [Kofleriaceae bacterium]